MGSGVRVGTRVAVAGGETKACSVGLDVAAGEGSLSVELGASGVAGAQAPSRSAISNPPRAHRRRLWNLAACRKGLSF